MNLIDALEILKAPIPNGAHTFGVFLATGFTPLHLKVFLEAELRVSHPRNQVGIDAGLFGDLIGNIERLDPSRIDALAVVVEWEDLDPRLGIRRLGGWRPAILRDIVQSAERSAERLQISQAAATTFD